MFVGNLRVGLGYELLKGFVRARPRWREVSGRPLLVLHGTDDEATDPRASRRFFDAATSADKKFVSLEGACHLICHEAGAARRVMDEVLAFVTSRAARAARGGATGREWAAEAGSQAASAAGGSAGREEEVRRVAAREFLTFGRGRRGSGPRSTIPPRGRLDCELAGW